MARPARDKHTDIAFDATLRAAAPFQERRRKQRERLALAIEPSDLQQKVRVDRVSNLVLFVVDASWSMAVAERMSATKGAILSLLTDAYQRRDRVWVNRLPEGSRLNGPAPHELHQAGREGPN